MQAESDYYPYGGEIVVVSDNTNKSLQIYRQRFRERFRAAAGFSDDELQHPFQDPFAGLLRRTIRVLGSSRQPS
jgi:hypothetical protein